MVDEPNLPTLKDPTLKDCKNCKFKGVYHIKCRHCATILCFKCTLLPKENFLYFFLTNSQYRCTKCCVDDLIARQKHLNVHYEKLDSEVELIQNCDENNTLTQHPKRGSSESNSVTKNSDQNRPDPSGQNAPSPSSSLPLSPPPPPSS